MPHTSDRQWKMLAIRPCAGAGGSCRFAVRLERGGDRIDDLKLEAADLLDYATFQAQVLKMSGRLVRFASIEDVDEPAVAWLDLVEASLPAESPRRAASGFSPSPPPQRVHTHDGVFQEIGGGD